MALAFIDGLMGHLMKVTFSKIKNMAKVLSLIKMVNPQPYNGIMEKLLVELKGIVNNKCHLLSAMVTSAIIINNSHLTKIFSQNKKIKTIL